MLEAVNISHAFQQGTPWHREVLGGVNLRLTPGKSMLLTGPSGCGKTTLARILTGLESPAQGRVRMTGVDIYGAEAGCIPRNQLVLAPQYPERQFFARTVLEELTWGLTMGLGLDEFEYLPRLETLCESLSFPLAELASRSPRSLSFGQQRKTALISLLALEPRVLILDEPLTGLNAKERRHLSEFLRLWPKKNRSMLVIAHQLDLFLSWVAEVAVLAGGRLTFCGSAIKLCQITEPSVLQAVVLPPSVEVSRRLKQHDLSGGSVSADKETVCQQLRYALTRIRNNRGEAEEA